MHPFEVSPFPYMRALVNRYRPCKCSTLIWLLANILKACSYTFRPRGLHEFERLFQFYRDPMIWALALTANLTGKSNQVISNPRSTRTEITRSQTIGRWRVTLDSHSMNKSDNNWVNCLPRYVSRCFHAQSKQVTREVWNIPWTCTVSGQPTQCLRNWFTSLWQRSLSAQRGMYLHERCLSQRGDAKWNNHTRNHYARFSGSLAIACINRLFYFAFRWHEWLDVLDPVHSSEPRCLLIKQVVMTTFYLPSTSPGVMPSTSQAVRTIIWAAVVLSMCGIACINKQLTPL
jgi:hypothetical protein